MKQEYIRRAAACGWQGTDVRGTAMSAGAEIGRNSRSAGRALAMVMAFMMAVSMPFGPMGAKAAYAEEATKYEITINALTVSDAATTSALTVIQGDYPHTVTGGSVFFRDYRDSNEVVRPLGTSVGAVWSASSDYKVNLSYTEKKGYHFYKWKDDTTGPSLNYISGTTAAVQAPGGAGKVQIVHDDKGSPGVDLLQISALSAPCTFTAVFIPNEYQFHLDGNCSGDATYSCSASDPIFRATYSDGLETSTFSAIASEKGVAVLPVPSRTGYTFTGWYTASTGGIQVSSSSGAIQDIYKVSGKTRNLTLETLAGADLKTTDIKLYAQWIENKYTVTFDAAGGSIYDNEKKTSAGGSASKTLSYSEIAGKLLKDCSWINGKYTAKRDGYTFNGWYTEAEGGTQITDSTGAVTPASLTFGAITGGDLSSGQTRKLYAHWMADQYQIHFNAGEGYFPENESQHTTDVSILFTETISNLFKAGGTSAPLRKLEDVSDKMYFFRGWSVNKDDTAPGTGLNGDQLSGATLYSNRSALKMTDNQITAYAIWASPEVKLFLDPDGGVFDDHGTTSSAVTSTALYKSQDGGTVDFPVSGYNVSGSALTLTKDGYAFGGWSRTKGTTAVSGADIPASGGTLRNVSENTTLYAVWIPKTFTIHFKLGHEETNYISGQQPADMSGVHLDEQVTLPNLGTSYKVQTGYAFSGWTLNPSAMVSDDDPVYHGGRKESFGYDIVGENSEITLYAVVKPLRLKITLAVNHTGYQGSWSADAGTFAYGSQVTLPEMNYSLSCDCSEFLGWSLKTNGTSDDALFRKAGDAVSASAIYGKLTSPVIRDGIVDVKLYDTWAGNSYRINFVPAAPEAGEGAPECTISMPAISGSSQTGALVPAGGMEFSGYTLTGWTTATGGALVYTADGKARITGAAAAEIFAAQGGAPGAPADRTIYLYPVWTPKYTITLIAATKDEAAGDGSYILNSTTGGAVSSRTGSEVTVTDGQAVPGSLGITAKPQHGYEFTGWRAVTGGVLSGSAISTQDDLTDLVYDSGEFGKFLTLAACFEKKDYTFTLNASAHSRIELLKNDSEFPPASSGAAVSSPAGVTAENGQERGINYRLGDALAIRITELSPSDYPLVHVILKYGEDRASQTAATLSLETLKQYAKAETEGGYNCYTLKLEELIRAAGQNVKEYWTEEGLTGTWLLTAECSETKVLPRFTVTGEVGAGSGHGSVSPSYKDAVSGESVSVTVTPDSGYYISKLTVTSGGSTADKTPSGYASSAVVLSCTAETKVYAEFSAVPQLYHVTKAGTSNGSFSLSHSGEVASGTRVTVYADPDSGYRVKAVYVNGVFRSYSDSYSFTVTEDSEVYVVFERGGTRYTITGIETDHGTLSIDEEVVEKGDDLTVKIRPDSGYKISRLYVDGSSVTVTSSYTFTNIRKDHTIRAVFAKGSSEYTIRGTAGTGGTVSIGTKTVDAGDDLTVTISAYSGYRISDVLVDGKSVGTVSKYTFEDIDDDHTIQAVFTEANFVNSGQYGMVNDGGITMTPSTFADVNAGDWYYQAMKFVTERGMMNRTSNNTMSPNVNASRADIVYMLYQYDGAPSASTSSRFYDVYSTSWYARSVNWASNYGIAAGISSTQFNPNGSVTREQLAAIMYRYAQYKGGNVTNTGDYSIRTFSDRNSISPYAKDAVCWACNSGLLSGKTGTRLDPKGSATRAEAATIIMRFCNSL